MTSDAKHAAQPVTLRPIVLILIIQALESVAELCFKSATTSTDITNVTLANCWIFMSRMLASGALWLGVGCFLVIFCLWMMVLAKLDLSVAFPLGNATYIAIPILAIIVLHEHVPLLRWLGILLVVVGSYYVSVSAAPSKSP